VGIFVTAVNRSQLNAVEQQLSDQFSASIRRGFKAKLTPDTVRSVFEDALRRALVEAKPC
ncbi:MAG: hypothetical protein KGQ51_18035, partial [Planctomycetes bacterium]|nr:hypothetical protein [Planctomycetota bacterium]